MAISEKEISVVPGAFDPYRSNLVAPDHLLSGSAQNGLSCTYGVRQTAELRRMVNVGVVNALRRNRLVYQNSIFNEKRKYLDVMMLSGIFSVPTFSVPVFEQLTASHNEIYIIIKYFSAISTLIPLVYLGFSTYCWSEIEVDGYAYSDFVSGASKSQ